MSVPITVPAGGVDFRVLTDGPADGPLALCLHGFPDAAPTWRWLLPRLAEAGFRAVAPWMRGYAPTGPAPDGRYQTGALVADACAMHEALGGDERAVVIGHDWGAQAAYGAAGFAPERWRRVVAMAVPPTPVVATNLLRYEQLRRSWYFFFFQSPLAELAVTADDLAFLDYLWADWSPGYDASVDLAGVKEALRDPASLSAALGYYRATFGAVPHDPALAGQQAATSGIPGQPTLYLHGTDDGCMGVEMTEGLDTMLAAGSEVIVVKDAGHFLHLERPDEINAAIVAFVS